MLKFPLWVGSHISILLNEQWKYWLKEWMMLFELFSFFGLIEISIIEYFPISSPWYFQLMYLSFWYFPIRYCPLNILLSSHLALIQYFLLHFFTSFSASANTFIYLAAFVASLPVQPQRMARRDKVRQRASTKKSKQITEKSRKYWEIQQKITSNLSAASKDTEK